MDTKQLASRENDDARLLNGVFNPLAHQIDPDFDHMMNFGLHDEQDVRSIMDLPYATEAKIYA